jgi:hypothetical protein
LDLFELSVARRIRLLRRILRRFQLQMRSDGTAPTRATRSAPMKGAIINNIQY